MDDNFIQSREEYEECLKVLSDCGVECENILEGLKTLRGYVIFTPENFQTILSVEKNNAVVAFILSLNKGMPR